MSNRFVYESRPDGRYNLKLRAQGTPLWVSAIVIAACLVVLGMISYVRKERAARCVEAHGTWVADSRAFGHCLIVEDGILREINP